MTGTTLLLDPGHGGATAAGASSANRGRSAAGLLEKDLTLDLARRIRDRLTQEHVVILTRDSDVNLTLAARADVAKRLGADVFVSLHFSGQDPAVDRTDAVVSTAASPASRRLAESLRARIATVTGAGGEVLTADLGQLAADRHDPRTAVCLLEVASLASPNRAVQLADLAYVDRLADAIAGAIRDHVRGAGGATPQWFGTTNGYARSASIFAPAVDPNYRPTTIADAVALWVDYTNRLRSWSIGVPNEALSSFPHSAICQLDLVGADGNTYVGPASTSPTRCCSAAGTTSSTPGTAVCGSR